MVGLQNSNALGHPEEYSKELRVLRYLIFAKVNLSFKYCIYQIYNSAKFLKHHIYKTKKSQQNSNLYISPFYLHSSLL